MNDNYHYASGAIHHQNNTTVNIGYVAGSDLRTLLGDLLARAAVSAPEAASEAPAHEPAPSAPPSPSAPALPDDLSSPAAMKYWQRLQEAGFVDARYRLAQGVSRRQAAYIADEFAHRLGLKACWKPFEQLWDKKHLAQEKWCSLETGAPTPRSRAIDAIFAD